MVSRTEEGHLADWPVGVQKIGFQKGIKEIAGDAFDGVIDRQHMNAFAVLDISTLHQ